MTLSQESDNTISGKAPTVALVTARAAAALDEDLQPLLEALHAAGAAVQAVNWDDSAVAWQTFDIAVLRSTWDYTMRLQEFLRWSERIAASTRLCNALALIRWNIDKHYLQQLAAQGLAIVPSQFVEPDADARTTLADFLTHQAEVAEMVVKPAIGAGSRDAERHGRDDVAAILAHIKRLQVTGRSALLQPYLDRVDAQGETALIYFSGQFSHAIRKGPLLRRGGGATRALFAPEQISPRTPSADELHLADAVVAGIPGGAPLYARVDLIRDRDGAPCVLELELTEPSLFFAQAPGAAAKFASEILRRIGPVS